MYAAPQYGAPGTYATRDWPTPLFAPTCSCMPACCGCGFVPLFQIIMGAAPFKVLGSVVQKDACVAMLIALLLWFGTVHGVGHTVGIILLVGWIVLSVELKNHLAIDESDIVTMLKAFFCPPCHVGQMKEGVDAFGSQYGGAATPPT